MTRRVIIIGSPLSMKTQDVRFYHGVTEDADTYVRFFKSATGGAFDASEIFVLVNPTWEALRKTLRSQETYYTILVYTGHGFISERTSKTTLNINSRERIEVSRIISHIQSDRKLLLIDTCRVKTNQMESFSGLGDPEWRLHFPSSLSKIKARRIFDGKLAQTSEGTQIIYSCSPGEYSGIDFHGSTFTHALLRPVSNWSKIIDRGNTLSIRDSFRFSRIILRNHSQRPTQLVSKISKPNFPFAVRYTMDMLQKSNRIVYYPNIIS
jgi:hypothetical protein